MNKQERFPTIGEIIGLDKGDLAAAEVFRIYRGLEGELFRLPLRDQYVYFVFRLKSEVMNGGIDQFFCNGSGDYAIETYEAVKAIGATGAERLLREAIDLFPGNQPSRDRDVRREQVRAITGDDDGARRPHLDDLVDSDLDPNLFEILRDYWRSHGG